MRRAFKGRCVEQHHDEYKLQYFARRDDRIDEAFGPRHLTTRAHAAVRKLRPHLRAALAAAAANKSRLDVGKPRIIRPAVSVGLDVMAATVIAAMDQHIAHAGFAHLAEGDLLRRETP
ncbi:hypothetical protein ACVWZR_006578 [Bradyrhizobium sp. i1.3.1]